MTTNDSSICVFYDGECPLCRREVTRYRKLINYQFSRDLLSISSGCDASV